MADTDPSATQLRAELRAAIARALRDRRPLLHHLNPDTSWLLQIPRPPTRRGKTKAKNSGGRGRVFYNVLIDPWLFGGQADVAPWFSQQWHAVECAVGSVGEVDALLREVEGLAREGEGEEEEEREEEQGTLVDVVAVSHEFTDHCHRETLEQVHRDVPVFASDKAAGLIRSWNHFRNVVAIPAFDASPDSDWRTFSLSPLPTWLSITRLINSKDALYYHSAVLIAFPASPLSPDSPAEAVIYTPHGVASSAIPDLRTLSPPINTLALLHGLHDVSLPKQQLNLGAHNGLQAQRLLKAKYWIGTHDEVKKGGGLVSWFLRRQVISFKEAIEKERAGKGHGLTKAEIKEWDEVDFLEVGNGESVVLR